MEVADLVACLQEKRSGSFVGRPRVPEIAFGGTGPCLLPGLTGLALETDSDFRVFIALLRICRGSLVEASRSVGPESIGLPEAEENDRDLCLHVEHRDFDPATCGDINGVSNESRADVESVAASVIGDVEVVEINHH